MGPRLDEFLPSQGSLLRERCGRNGIFRTHHRGFVGALRQRRDGLLGDRAGFVAPLDRASLRIADMLDARAGAPHVVLLTNLIFTGFSGPILSRAS